MNARLKKVPDGSGGPNTSEVCWFRTNGINPGTMDFGEIYWPFAAHWTLNQGLYRVTHLPTGRFVIDGISRRVALRLIATLRALPIDLEFTRFKQKDDPRLAAMGEVVKKFKRYAKVKA